MNQDFNQTENTPVAPTTIENLPPPGFHRLDYSKITSLGDIISILQVVDFTFSEKTVGFEKIKHLIK
jgi:hypothetical protein